MYSSRFIYQAPIQLNIYTMYICEIRFSSKEINQAGL